jgi:hypothetical protein
MSGKSDNRKVSSEYGLAPLTAPMRGPVEARLEQLKEQLLRPTLEKVADSRVVKDICWAANEAAALAWLTVCPLLVFPDLLEEKVRAALQRWERQAHLYPR